MNSKNKKLHTLLACCVASMALGGCEMYAPSALNTSRIQVAERSISRQMSTSEVTEDSLAALAQEYNNHGGTPISLIVTYDPQSKRNTARVAGDRLASYARSLRKYGVGHIETSILPVKDQGDEGRVMVSFRAITASGPEGCGDMPGMNDHVVEPDPNYRLGCGVDTMMAKQVARPTDLLGRGASDPTTDGRAAANIIDVYRTGVQNKPLDGEQASDKE